MNLFLTDAAIAGAQQVVVQAMADIATIGLLRQRDLHGRIGIEQAREILAERGHITVDAAFDLLHAHAR